MSKRDKWLIVVCLLIAAWAAHRLYVEEVDALNDGNHMISPAWHGGY